MPVRELFGGASSSAEHAHVGSFRSNIFQTGEAPSPRNTPHVHRAA